MIERSLYVRDRVIPLVCMRVNNSQAAVDSGFEV
jgi:hypothetical protein